MSRLLLTSPLVHIMRTWAPSIPLPVVGRAMFTLDPSTSGWPGNSLHLLEKGQNQPIVRFAYLCHVIGEEFVFLSFLHSTTDPRPPTIKSIYSRFHVGAAALSAPRMRVCCLFASDSFTSWNSSSLSVDRLNSKIYTIYKPPSH